METNLKLPIELGLKSFFRVFLKRLGILLITALISFNALAIVYLIYVDELNLKRIILISVAIGIELVLFISNWGKVEKYFREKPLSFTLKFSDRNFGITNVKPTKEEFQIFLRQSLEVPKTIYLKNTEENYITQFEKELIDAEIETLTRKSNIQESVNHLFTKNVRYGFRTIDNQLKLIEFDAKTLENNREQIDLVEKMLSLVAKGIVPLDKLGLSAKDILLFEKYRSALERYLLMYYAEKENKIENK